MIRAFVGVPVPAAAARDLEAAQAGLPVGNPVPRENFHVTLAFLGERQEPVIEDVHDALAPIRAGAIEVTIAGLGTFGGDQPRVLYAAVTAAPGLSELRRKVRSAVRAAGIELAHERFLPHVTLARLGRGAAPEDVAALQGFIARRIGRVSASYTAEAFCLYESHLGRNGPAYSVLAEYPLGE